MRPSALMMLGLLACSSTESKGGALDGGAPDAPSDGGPSDAHPDADADAAVAGGLTCTRTADCATGVCCRDVLPLGPSECRSDCFTNAPRVQMCARGDTCQNGHACEAWPDRCGGQSYCESATSYCP